MSLAVANRSTERHTAGHTAPSQVRVGRYSRYDWIWAAAITATDAVLRRAYGVQSFTTDPDCLLRIARATAPREIALNDRTCVHAGEPIALLHFWNEHIPPFPPGGPDLAWAKAFRHRMNFSLRALSRYLAEDRSWDDVHAIHGCVNFGNRQRRWQIQLAAARFGFELVPVEVPCGLHEMGEDILIWCFARAFNPAALRRHVLWRDRTELWISRDRLASRYG